MRGILSCLVGMALLLAIAACDRGDDRPILAGRAILPADTFAPGPPVGRELDDNINGRRPPFASTPVQGFSSLVAEDDGTVVVLGDNGFGNRANSPDHPLRWYRLRLHLDFPPRHGGRVEVLRVTDLTDPECRISWARGDREDRRLHGDDLDPESFVRLDDGTFWIGEEFGPYLVHCGPDGTVLEPPVPVPVPEALQAHAGASTTLRSPDHPDFCTLRESVAVAAANLPRSGGLEGLALAPDGEHLYAVVEKGLVADPDLTRRLILEFDALAGAFTGRWWTWRVDEPGLSVASAACTAAGALLVMERDEHEGVEARIKRVYRGMPGDAGRGEEPVKTLVADLLHLADPDGLTAAEPASLGLGPAYAFPYVTPECLAVLDDRTLLVANDNNYPFSTGRRVRTPDDNEFITLRLPRDLD